VPLTVEGVAENRGCQGPDNLTLVRAGAVAGTKEDHTDSVVSNKTHHEINEARKA
jgi:hypothetical protein